MDQTPQLSWLQYFVNIAQQIKLKSKDERTQIGCVVVGPDKEIRSTGYNSFPRGIDDNVRERQERPEKYFWFAHAERNALYNAARVGTPMKGCTIVMTCGVPCADCAIGIIQSGIEELWINEVEQNGNNAKWTEHSVRSLQMFKEAGVKVNYWKYDENQQVTIC